MSFYKGVRFIIGGPHELGRGDCQCQHCEQYRALYAECAETIPLADRKLLDEHARAMGAAAGEALDKAMAETMDYLGKMDDPTPVLSPGTIADDAANTVYDNMHDDQRALIYNRLIGDGWNRQKAENQRHKARSK